MYPICAPSVNILTIASFADGSYPVRAAATAVAQGTVGGVCRLSIVDDKLGLYLQEIGAAWGT